MDIRKFRETNDEKDIIREFKNKLTSTNLPLSIEKALEYIKSKGYDLQLVEFKKIIDKYTLRSDSEDTIHTPLFQVDDQGNYEVLPDKLSFSPKAFRMPDDTQVEGDQVQRFSHFRGIQSSEEPEGSTKIHPLLQSICVTGETGVGKTQTITEVLENEGHEFEIYDPTLSTTGLLFMYDSKTNSYKLGRLGKFMVQAAKNPDKLYTFVIDNAHKKDTIRMINDELKQALSTRRNKGRRYVMREDSTERDFDGFLEKIPGGNFKVPDNLGFILITSMPIIMKGNPELSERLDFVEFSREHQGQINSLQDIMDLRDTQHR